MHLRFEDGKNVIVSRFSGQLKLCAYDRQGGKAGLVRILERTVGDRHQMAFYFNYKSGYYLMRADGDRLMLQNSDECQPAESDWFERSSVAGGNYYKLLSVVEPRRYLFVEQTKSRILSLSVNCFAKVTHEDSYVARKGSAR